MKRVLQIMAMVLIAFPAWAEDSTSQPEKQLEAPSTLYMSLQEVQATSAKETKAPEAQQIKGIPNPPPPKTSTQPGWAEKLVSGVISQAARQEQLNNPDRDLRPRVEPVNPNVFPRDPSPAE